MYKLNGNKNLINSLIVVLIDSNDLFLVQVLPQRKRLAKGGIKSYFAKHSVACIRSMGIRSDNPFEGCKLLMIDFKLTFEFF